MRNGFDLIKVFYSWVFNNQEKPIRPHHVSLYMFFVNQNNRNNWVDWFKCPYDLAMQGSCITSKRDYYRYLHDLEKWGLIGYIPGQAMHKSPLISLTKINQKTTDKPLPKSEIVGYQIVTQPDTQHDTQPDTQDDTQHDTQPDTHIKHVTSNPNTCNVYSAPEESEKKSEQKEESEQEQKKDKNPPPTKKTVLIPTEQEFLDYVKKWMEENNKDFIGKRVQLISKYQAWVSDGWKDGNGSPIKNWKTKIQNTEPYLKSDYAKSHSASRKTAREPVSGTSFGSL